MKVNCVSQNYYQNYKKNNIQFGQKKEITDYSRVCTQALSEERVPYINVVDYILNGGVGMQNSASRGFNPKQQAQSELYINAICGDEYLYPCESYADDDLERTTY